MRLPSLPRVVARVWSWRGSAAYRRQPRPDEAAPVRVPGPDPLRVLVFGTDAASGWGVLRQDLALPGHLARSLRRLTGRGVEVTLVDCGVARVTDLAVAATALPSVAHEVAVVIGGVRDAVQVGEAARWRDAMAVVLDTVRTRSGAHVFLLGIPRPSTLSAFRLAPGGPADRAAEAFDRVSEDLCRVRSRTAFVPSISRPVPTSPGERLVSAPRYAALASHLAAAVVTHVDGLPGTPGAPPRA